MSDPDPDAESDHESECNDTDDEESRPSVTESGVPMIGRPSQKAQIEKALEWPEIGDKPIN